MPKQKMRRKQLIQKTTKQDHCPEILSAVPNVESRRNPAIEGGGAENLQAERRTCCGKRRSLPENLARITNQTGGKKSGFGIALKKKKDKRTSKTQQQGSRGNKKKRSERWRGGGDHCLKGSSRKRTQKLKSGGIAFEKKKGKHTRKGVSGAGTRTLCNKGEAVWKKRNRAMHQGAEHQRGNLRTLHERA